MDESKIKNVNYLTYGSIISFMLDYSDPNDFSSISYNNDNLISDVQEKNEDNADNSLISKNFLFSHGVFNEYCYFYKFKNREDLRNGFYNTLFIVLPGFEFDSMNDFKKLIKKIKNSGIFQKEEISKQQIIDNYKRFKQEIKTNHNKSIELMEQGNLKVNYNDCVLLMHLKSGKFLEYKLNNKNFKTYIQLTNHMSQRTLFRFVPAYEYQATTSTFCLYNLAIQIACGDKKAKKEKFLVNKNIRKNLNSEEKDISQEIINKEEEDNKIAKEEIRKSYFDNEDLKNIIKNIYNDDTQESKVLDEFSNYLIHENFSQKNFGVKLMPEENCVAVDDSSFSFWRLINFCEDYFEIAKYLNLLDYFCIENADSTSFIHLEEIKSETQNNSLLDDNKNNELFPIKEENDEINIIKDEEKEEMEISNISEMINAKENIPFKPLKKKLKYIKDKNNINDTTVVFVDNFNDSSFSKHKNYNLIIDSYKDKEEHLKPYSLFKFERVFDEDRDIDKDINNFSMNKMNIITEDICVRLINIFTNKVLYAEKSNNNQYKLVLINDMPEDDKRYPFTIFQLKIIKDIQEIEENEDKNEFKEKEDDKSEQNENTIINGIKKNSHIKIYSRKCSAFIGIKNDNKNKELVLTNSMCDIFEFKFNCLDEEDKYELNFFEQLLWSFDNILNYFKREDKTIKSIGENYERINHILITLKHKIKQFTKDNRDVRKLNLQENKFDFMEIIEKLNIVSKLIELFLTNWFKNYQVFSYNQLEIIIKKYFKDNNDILKYKLLISREIINILTIIYNLNMSYLNAIEDTLLYFFMFVGREDKITKFLVDLLKNNKLLLISLCPFSTDKKEIKEEPNEKEENINEINNISIISDNKEILKRKDEFKKFKFFNIKKCLKRIVNYYNNMNKEDIRINFSSLVLFFNLMNNLLILDNKPFKRFIDEYFEDLELLKKVDNSKMIPNYEKNPILSDFFIKDGEIYVRKISFKNKGSNEYNIIEEKLSYLIDIISNYNIDNEKERDKVLFAKLVSLNLFFYSFLSLCHEEFKNYMKNIFQFDYIISNYLTFTYNLIENNPDENIIRPIKNTKYENPLMNDLKCSIIQLLTYVYLKVQSPFTLQTHLFKVINSNQKPDEAGIEKFEIQKIIDFIFQILENKNEKIDLKKIEQYCLIQILELIKFSARYLYSTKKIIVQQDRNNIYTLIIDLMNLLEKLIGSSKENNSKFINDNEILESLNSIENDELNLKNPMILVSENFQYVFLKYKNLLEREIKKKREKGNNVKRFLDILSEICDKERIQKNKYDSRMEEITKQNIKILRNFNLKGVLMDVSINTDKNNENINNMILLIIEEIILEFLDYLEYSTIEDFGNENISEEKIKIKEYENNLKNEVVTKKISTKYLDEFKNITIKKNEYPLTLYFFKLLLYFDNPRIKNLALEIIYKLNNSKKIFYFNIDNIVILENEDKYRQLMEIKKIFIELFEKINDLNLIKRLDKNSISIFNEIYQKLNILLKKLFDEDDWNEKNNALNEKEDFNFEDSIGVPKEEEDDNSFLYSSKSKIDEDQKENDKESLNFGNNSNNTENSYFLDEYEPENLIIFQKSLYNLGFLHFINEYFTLIDEIKSELVDDLICIEESLIIIYKILVVFITKNEKSQTLIKNRLYLYICPLKMKKISSDLLYSINYFVFHLVYNFNKPSDYGKINNIELVTKRLYLLHQIDWNEQKNVMPYFVNTLLIFFQYSSPEYIKLIFILLDDIKKIVTTDIIEGNNNPNSTIILTKLLGLIEIELEKKYLKENRIRPLLSIKDIIRTFPTMIKLLIPKTKFDISNFKYSKPLILITNILFNYYYLYFKNYVEDNKSILLDSLLKFCHEATIKEDFIYKKSKYQKEISTENSNKNNLLKFFNEFMGFSLPKLFIILNNSGPCEGSEEILLKAKQFYEKIEEILLNDKENKINIFFKEEQIKEILNFCSDIENDYSSYLDPLFNIIEKLYENSLNQIIVPKVVDEKMINKKLDNLRKASSKRVTHDVLFEKKTIVIENLYDKEIEQNFTHMAKNEILDERRKFIVNLFSFFKIIKGNNKVEFNNIPNISFYINYCNSFTKCYENYILKNHFFFFYWTNIFLMQFNKKEDKFYEDKTKYNKEYFNDLSLIEFTIERFENININDNNYENLLYIKFLDNYLCELNEENRAHFLNKIIEKPESKNLFYLLHNILDNLFIEINKDFEEEDDKKKVDSYNKCHASVFEEEIDEYNMAIKFLGHLSQNNDIIKNKMKNYLRLQYNNIINHNFIIILSNILESFGNENNRKFIPKYYFIIISIIEFIIQCCNGPCKDNQDCVVKNTKILYFIKFILKYATYRKEKNESKEAKCNDDEFDKDMRNIEQNENEEDQNVCRALEVKNFHRRHLSYLKYKLLQLLNSLAIGRKKGDKTLDLIYQIIDFKVLVFVLIETFKEILIEIDAQKTPENIIIEENMLSRMNDLISYLNGEIDNHGKNFIIFEIGTYAFLLIDIFLEKITRHIDLNIYNKIIDLKKRLQKKKCNDKSNRIFGELIDFCKNLSVCYKLIIRKKNKMNKDEDFYLPNSFTHAYSFYFEYTPNIEIVHNGRIYKYFIRLSPICKCLTREMKDQFHSHLDRSSSKTKTEYLFKNVEFYRYQLIMNKKIFDAFNKAPILNLFFNHYKFYRDIFLIIAIVINLLIFVSFHRITAEKEKPMLFDYDFLYNKKKGVNKTRIAFVVFTIIEMVLSILILINYLIFRVSYFLYFKEENDEDEKDEGEKDEDEKNEDNATILKNFAKSGDILKYFFERMRTFLLNIIKDIRLFYYLSLIMITIAALATKKYKLLAVLLIDIIERSSTLMCIVKSFWIPIKPIIVTLLLFYIVAYYFIILIYLFIPDHLPYEDCLKFSNCYFVLCDQTIKNSNGIINYLTEEGLYISSSMWGNPRFWIDNWFAIIDLILVIQMFCGIIIDTFLSQKEKNKEIEDDKNNKCFICGLKKNQLNKYSNSEQGFNEHIKLEHYLWNYMFAIFNVTTGETSNFAFLDKIIKEGYETRAYYKWIPYKKCLSQLQSLCKNENEELEKEDNEEDDED